MANFFNSLGSSIVTGTDLQDQFFPFTSDTNLDHVFPDDSFSSFTWTTAIATAGGAFYEFNGANMQISTDLLLGGNKSDVLYGSNLNDAVLFNNGTIGSGVGGLDYIEQFYLGAGDDFMDLSAHGPGGVDYARDVVINGGAGNDVIIGGAGKDTISGDAGDDVIFGYRGADTINGGTGDDVLYGDDLGYNGIAGDDVLRGQAGNDTLYGGARTDRLEGGDGNDLLYGGLGGDTLLGGAGDDVLYGDDVGTSGNDKLDGESGNDRLYGGGGNDEVLGGSGNDILEGGDGNDFLLGGSDNDLLTGGGGSDTVDGGMGSDTAVFSGNRADYQITQNANGSVTIADLRGGSPDGIDTVSNVEFYQFVDGTIPAGELNTPPVITSNGGGATAAVSISENSAAVTSVAATDPDVGQTLSYSIIGGADASKFTIDAANGNLAFTTAPNFEAPTDADFDNIYDVVVQVSDGNGGIDTQVLAVAVTDITEGPGRAPVITSNGGGTAASVTLAENATAVTTVTATDVDGTTPTYLIAGGADAALFNIDPTTGELSFLNAPDFEDPMDADANNSYEVIVRATDGVNTDSQVLSVTVTNVNDNTPVIGSNGGGPTAAVNVAENTTAVTTVSATDADGTTPTYAIAGGADAALFSIDASTGELTFMTAPDFENPSDASADGVYEVVVKATDGTSLDEQALSIIVTNQNDNLPIISSNGGGSSAAITIAENTAGVTTVAASDADGTTPTYVIAGGADAALFGIDATTGALVFLAAPDFEHPLDVDADGIYEVIVQAIDGTNSDAQTLSVTVTDVNEVGKTITGTSGNNTINPITTVIALQTTALNDTILALGGNDTIDGGLGADRMEGGVGNDIYTVDRYSDDGFAGNDDQVIELAGAGTDLVNALVTYRLPGEVENLTLIGAAAISGTGNLLANIIVGNNAANVLSGEAGNDMLNGNAGDDTLYGGDGDDKLDGGTGADRMEGGAGNDTYTVDTYSDDGVTANDDQIIELPGGGTDSVNASVSYTLTDQVENLSLTGMAAINGTGNTLNNNIAGNSGDNLIGGLAGNDTLSGNAGADTLFGGDGNDTLTGGAGNDSLFGEAGIDNLQGGADNDLLDGGAGADTLSGQAGIDRLVGGIGKDTLTGGTESDTFVFNFGDTTLNSSSNDTIKDFQTGQDFVDLDFVSGGLAPSSYLEMTIANNNFTDALSAANAVTHAGIGAVFVAGSADGWLFWDSNGDAILDQSVVLTGLNSLSAFDSFDVV